MLFILCWSALLVEETGGPGENHRLVASHSQTLSLEYVQFLNRLYDITWLCVITNQMLKYKF